MPVELAVDLSALALYDIVIYADDSGSMESGDGERIEDLKLIVAKVAEVATLFDEDGIEVRLGGVGGTSGYLQCCVCEMWCEVGRDGVGQGSCGHSHGAGAWGCVMVAIHSRCLPGHVLRHVLKCTRAETHEGCIWLYFFRHTIPKLYAVYLLHRQP
jgi:hypothetical protein